MFPALTAYLARRADEAAGISAERRSRLDVLAQHMRSARESFGVVRLVFICTHNSRRSHFGQIWAQTAAAHFGVSKVETFSGGTEATAVAPPVLAALERAGFGVERGDDPKNPHHAVRFDPEAPKIVCFSKTYDDLSNPSADFIAVMTCSEADAACPVVLGAAHRVSLPYDDPKTADGTAGQQAAYDARCAQVATEMLYVFSGLAR